MPIGELLGCLFFCFLLALATVLSCKLSIRFQDNIRVVRFIMFGVWVFIADYTGQAMMALGGAVRENPRAEAQLGLNYLTGKMPGMLHQSTGMNLLWPKNPERGQYWLQKATATGNDGAEALLAYAYLDPRSGLRDPIKAIDHLAKVADNPKADRELRAEAAYELATMYEKGEGVPQNLSQSLKYRVVAADAGSGDAAFELADGFEKGKFGEVDYGKAYIYYKKAAENGNGAAYEGYGRLKAQLGQK